MDQIMGIMAFSNSFYARSLLKTVAKYNPYFPYF